MKNFTLSERQVEVCCLIASGCSDKEVAKELSISTYTVRHHLEIAAKRILDACPELYLSGDPRRVVLGYYVEYAGVAAFHRRRAEKKAA